MPGTISSVAGPAPVSLTSAPPVRRILLLGLGGLATGAIGPLYSTFVPPMVDGVVPTDVRLGLILAIDNALLFILVPWTGVLSDQRAAAGLSRRPLVVGGLIASAIGMAMLSGAAAWGLAGLLLSIIVLNTGQFVQRAPTQALVADLIPSRYRSFATGTVTAFMCLGAIFFLGIANVTGRPGTSFLAAAGTLLAVAAAFGAWLQEPAIAETGQAETTFGRLWSATRTVASGAVPGLRAAFIATVFVQLSFQTFASWFSLYASERFGVDPAEATLAFIAWAVGGLVGSVPAGYIGARMGRRSSMLAGLACMAVVLFALHFAPTLNAALPLVFAASFFWGFPTVNAFPLVVEPIRRDWRGVLSAILFLCLALGGLVGDPLNGFVFESMGSRRWLFLVMGIYTAAAFMAVLRIPKGAGEADTGAP